MSGGWRWSVAKKTVTSAEMRTAVRERYGRAAAVFDEVGDSTGARGERRRADCVAMGLWPSRGLYLEGIEIKVSRPDWIAELKDPSKADAVGKYCDFWWLAIADASIVRDGELPLNWGLLVLEGKALKVVKQAPKLEGAELDRGFVAALLRRAAEEQDRRRQTAELVGYERGVAAAERPRDDTETARELAALKGALEDFETKSGLKIERWGAGNLGEAVAKLRKLNDWRRGDPVATIERAADQLERQVADLRKEALCVKRELKISDAVDVKEAV